MAQEVTSFFISWFIHPNALGLILALLFGAIWLLPYYPPFRGRMWLIAVLVASAMLTLIAVTFVQLPLQALTRQLLKVWWSEDVLRQGLLFAGIPFILLSGLVQEGAKLVPVVLYWLDVDKDLDPKMGLIIGAVAGVGFGIFESHWAHSAIFASGWTWAAVGKEGFVALAGFWERFFTTALHTALSGLAGYGLAKGWGWQAYLAAAFLHTLANYAVILVQAGSFSIMGAEVYIAVLALAVSALALWLRWRGEGIAATLPKSWR